MNDVITATCAPVRGGEGSRVSNDGLRLHYQWQAPARPRATVVIVHGVAEHIGRYAEFEALLVAAQYACYGYDQRGHGRSQGTPGHVDRFQRYIDDLDQAVEHARAILGAAPIFVFGQSMGTIVASLYGIQRQARIAGLILSACPVRTHSRPAPWLLRLIELLSFLFPRLPLPNTISPTELSHDPQVQAEYATDRSVHKTVTAAWIREFFAATQLVLDGAPSLRIPVLALHGGADRIADPAGARALIELIGSEDKTLVIEPGVRHEPLQEAEPYRPWATRAILEWLARHVPAARAADQG